MPRVSTATESPIFTTLDKFKTSINGNAMNIPSWTSYLGHLYLTIKPAKFKIANSNRAAVIPTDSGLTTTAPTRVTRIATAALALDATAAGTTEATELFTAQEAIRDHQQLQASYVTYFTASTFLKSMILNCVDDKYINPLCDATTFYALVTFNDLLKHLWENYGSIDQTDLSASGDRMKAPWYPPTPTESLFKQMYEGQKYASRGGETISNEHMVRYTYNTIVATGLFAHACTKRRKCISSDRTWEKLQEILQGS